jgi:hypothetical protein
VEDELGDKFEKIDAGSTAGGEVRRRKLKPEW